MFLDSYVQKLQGTKYSCLRWPSVTSGAWEPAIAGDPEVGLPFSSILEVPGMEVSKYILLAPKK